ncbi:MAG: class D sortase [Bryobacteraceae bacterium]|jgi:sortase A
MRLVVKRELLRRVLLWPQRVLFAGGFLLLGYCGWVLTDTWLFQQRESRQFERLLDRRHTDSAAAAIPTSLEGPAAIAAAGLIGRIEIAHLGLSAMVMEGDDRRTLRRAVGHIPGTSLPGEIGNVVLTGHRDTFFRPLRNISRDDIITLTTLQGQYRYRVLSTQVVSPDNLSILDASQNEILTLITCHPFYFVGAAPNRFIVRAERME